MHARFTEIPVDSIDLLPNARTEPRSPEGRAGMAESIKRHGVQSPVTVVARGDRFGLLLGTGRFAGTKEAGGKTIPAIVLTEEPSEADRLILQLTENLQREDLNPVDIARAIRRIMELSGCTASGAVARLGYSGPSASRWLKLLDLPEDVLRKVQSGAIGASAGYALAKVNDPDARASLAEEAGNGLLSREALNRKIKRLNRQRNAGGAASGKLQRITASVGRSQAVTFIGRDLTLDTVIEWLSVLLAKANHARAEGCDLATFAKRASTDRRAVHGVTA